MRALEIARRRRLSLTRRMGIAAAESPLARENDPATLRHEVINREIIALNRLVQIVAPLGSDAWRCYESPIPAGDYCGRMAREAAIQARSARLATCYGCGATDRVFHAVDDIHEERHGYCESCQRAWGDYEVKPGQIKALSPEAREWFRATLANVRASDARIAKRSTIKGISELNPTVAAREAGMRRWANANPFDWRKASKARPAAVKPANIQATRAKLERRLARLQAKMVRLAA